MSGYETSVTAIAAIPNASTRWIGCRPSNQPANRLVGKPLTTIMASTIAEVFASKPSSAINDSLKRVSPDQTASKRAEAAVKTQNVGVVNAEESERSRRLSFELVSDCAVSIVRPTDSG